MKIKKLTNNNIEKILLEKFSSLLLKEDKNVFAVSDIKSIVSIIDQNFINLIKSNPDAASGLIKTFGSNTQKRLQNLVNNIKSGKISTVQQVIDEFIAIMCINIAFRMYNLQKVSDNIAKSVSKQPQQQPMPELATRTETPIQ